AGTGLGLSTAFGVVTQSGGHLRARSDPGAGSTFEIWLPVTPRASGDHLGQRTAALPSGTTTHTRVLLVEDEPGILRLTTRALQRAGFHVLTAADGRQAVELARDERRVDVVVTDLGLPDIDGQQVAGRIREHWPQVPVLYVSGFVGAHPPEVRTPEGEAFLPKPYTPDQLISAIQRLLALPIS
ncbi:MAG: response regulator, partial [Myxococcales bacterium]|nr:response regulator [Myxococcales bacterium]